LARKKKAEQAKKEKEAEDDGEIYEGKLKVIYKI